MRFPDTITVRTPFISNILLPTGHSTVRSPFTARIFLFPFTAYRSISATDLTVHPSPPVITGRFTVVFVTEVLFDVVEVFPLVAVIKFAKRFPGLRNAWSERFAEDPIDETTAPDTFTESFTRSTPASVKIPIVPSSPTILPKNALLRVGPRLVSLIRAY